MNTMEALLTRRSIRKFRKDEVSNEIIQKIMDAGLAAATARNLQSHIVVAVKDPEIREELRKDNILFGNYPKDSDPFYGAPVILIVLANKSCPNHVYDGSLALGNMMLAAHELGLGTCWIHRARQEFEMNKWQKWLASLGVEGEYEGIGHLSLGYADCELPKPPYKKENRSFIVE